MATNINLTYVETGFEVSRFEVTESLDLKVDRSGLEPEVTATVAAKGCRMSEVGSPTPVGLRQRERRSSGTTECAVSFIGQYSIVARPANPVCGALVQRTDL